ncbi:hypothetical protein TNCV_4687061 [Trichonephila clavipes]|nr:hypothetical protein TNCV_4687061 [Trichonephila clavipes]
MLNMSLAEAASHHIDVCRVTKIPESTENSSSISTQNSKERFITKLPFKCSLDVKAMKISSEVESPSGVS